MAADATGPGRDEGIVEVMVPVEGRTQTDAPAPLGVPDVFPITADAAVAIDAHAACSGACIIGTKRCGDSDGIQLCVDVQGCGAWGAETMCPAWHSCRRTENACSETPSCGTPVPNPVSAGLPNPASYDTTTKGLVIDRVTELMWEHPWTAADASYKKIPHADAVDHCKALRTGGFSNWRLPTRREMVSIVDFTSKPAINETAFPHTPPEAFWTSSDVTGLAVPQPGYRWFVDFSLGGSFYGKAESSRAVRCVRGSPLSCPGGRFSVTNGWVLDATTKLSWQQMFAAGDWNQAKAACAALGNGARLPSLTELQTIVDDSRARPAIDQVAFSKIAGESFWTSSLPPASPGTAWSVMFQFGGTYQLEASRSHVYRCVR